MVSFMLWKHHFRVWPAAGDGDKATCKYSEGSTVPCGYQVDRLGLSSASRVLRRADAEPGRQRLHTLKWNTVIVTYHLIEQHSV